MAPPTPGLDGNAHINYAGQGPFSDTLDIPSQLGNYSGISLTGVLVIRAVGATGGYAASIAADTTGGGTYWRGLPGAGGQVDVTYTSITASSLSIWAGGNGGTGQEYIVTSRSSGQGGTSGGGGGGGGLTLIMSNDNAGSVFIVAGGGGGGGVGPTANLSPYGIGGIGGYQSGTGAGGSGIPYPGNSSLRGVGEGGSGGNGGSGGSNSYGGAGGLNNRVGADGVMGVALNGNKYSGGGGGGGWGKIGGRPAASQQVFTGGGTTIIANINIQGGCGGSGNVINSTNNQNSMGNAGGGGGGIYGGGDGGGYVDGDNWQMGGGGGGAGYGGGGGGIGVYWDGNTDGSVDGNQTSTAGGGGGSYCNSPAGVFSNSAYNYDSAGYVDIDFYANPVPKVPSSTYGLASGNSYTITCYYINTSTGITASCPSVPGSVIGIDLTSASANQLTFTPTGVPPGQNIIFTVYNQNNTTPASITILSDSPPVISSVTGALGLVANTQWTVTGSNFVGATLTSSSSIVISQLSINNAAEIITFTPTSVTAGTAFTLTVTNSDTLTTTYTSTSNSPPVISTIPSYGVVSNKSITITGTNIAIGATLSFTGSSFTFTAANTITFNAPVSTPGTSLSFTITNPDTLTTSGTLPYDPLPTITSVEADTGHYGIVTGHVLKMTGTNFVTGAQVFVQGNPTAAATTYNNSTYIDFTALTYPPGTVVNIYVMNTNNLSSTLFSLQYDFYPVITDISSVTGIVAGNTLTMNGTNFQANPTITIDNIGSFNGTYINATTITFIAPIVNLQSPQVTVYITNEDTLESQSPYQLTYNTPPKIINVIPTYPSVGIASAKNLTIQGSKFISGYKLYLNGTDIASSSLSSIVDSSNITFTAPTYSPGTTLPLYVQNYDDLSSNIYSLTYDFNPIISAITAEKGFVTGHKITIQGSSFEKPISVDISSNGSLQNATVLNSSSNSITFTSPTVVPGTTVDIIVTNPNGLSVSQSQRYDPTPNITSITAPNNYIVSGNTFTITGTDFSGAKVKIDQREVATNISDTSTNIVFVAPANYIPPGSNVKFTVTNFDGLFDSSYLMSDPKPIITTFDATQRGIISYVPNALIKINGTSFDPAATVNIKDGLTEISANIVSPAITTTDISFNIPSGLITSGGTPVTFTITNPDGLFAQKVLPSNTNPVITLDKVSGISGEIVTITNSSPTPFYPIAPTFVVDMCGTPLTPFDITSTTLKIRMPYHPVNDTIDYFIKVTNGDGLQSNIEVFIYTIPILSHLTLTGTEKKITSGIAGLPITIHGKGFIESGVNVYVDNKLQPSERITDRRINIIMPPGYLCNRTPIYVETLFDGIRSRTDLYYTYAPPSSTYPVDQENVPLPRETTLCFIQNKRNTITYTQNREMQTKNQYWDYLSNQQTITQPCPVPIPPPPIPPTCPSMPTCESSGVPYTTQAQLNTLNGCTDISGDILISGFTDQPDFSVFDCLRSINGSLDISGNSGLITIAGFSSLTDISGNFNIANNAALTTITAFYNLAHVRGNFNINTNAALTTMTSFYNLTDIRGNFNINTNAALKTMPAFSSLTDISGNFNINTNAALTTLPSFLLLTRIGSYFSVYNNAALLTISGFDLLATVSGNFNIDTNAALKKIMGFVKLTTITGYFNVNKNDVLKTISGFNLLATIGNYFSIYNNIVLTTIPGFNALQTIGGYYSIYSNIALNNISGFDALTSIHGAVNIYNNGNLNTITGFIALTSIIGDFTVKNNNSLKSISTFTALTDISGNFNINTNIKLTTLPSFSALQTIRGYFSIINNIQLQLIQGFTALNSIPGYFSIVGNTAVTSITGFTSAQFTAINGYFNMKENNSLTNLTGFNFLQTISGNFNMNTNNLLTSVTGFDSLQTITGNFNISVNNALTILPNFLSLTTINGSFLISYTKLASIPSFPAITDISGNFRIDNNPLLTTISAFSLLANINGTFDIENNGYKITPPTTSPPIVTTISGFLALTPVTGIKGNATIAGADTTRYTRITAATDAIIYAAVNPPTYPYIRDTFISVS